MKAERDGAPPVGREHDGPRNPGDPLLQVRSGRNAGGGAGRHGTIPCPPPDARGFTSQRVPLARGGRVARTFGTA